VILTRNSPRYCLVAETKRKTLSANRKFFFGGLCKQRAWPRPDVLCHPRSAHWSATIHRYWSCNALMISDIVEYLRERALICTRLARACSDLATSRELEGLATDLMAKAKELEEFLQ
jgi:hypothetical protein